MRFIIFLCILFLGFIHTSSAPFIRYYLEAEENFQTYSCASNTIGEPTNMSSVYISATVSNLSNNNQGKEPSMSKTHIEQSDFSSILRKANVKNLRILGLVWGFLKYYHPKIAEGTLDWDKELLNLLPKYCAIFNSTERDVFLLEWIRSLGPYETQNKLQTIDSLSIKLNPELSWIESNNFTDTLKQELINITYSQRKEKHHYIAFDPGAGNPIFTNEQPYSDSLYPDTEYRLLALFRYWNIIQYYYPNRHLIKKNWYRVLDKYIPETIKASDIRDYTLLLLELISTIEDTHANIWGGNETILSFFGKRYAAAHTVFIQNKLVVTGYYDTSKASECHLQIGDIITHINGKTIKTIIKTHTPYTPASNKIVQLRDIARNSLRTNNDTITVHYIRGNKKGHAVLPTYLQTEIDVFSVFNPKSDAFSMLKDGIGYLNIGSLRKNEIATLWNEIQKTQSLLLDLRFYPKEFSLYELCNYLLPNTIPFVKFSNGSLQHPGMFTFTNVFSVGKSNSDYYKGKIIILVNQNTQSLGEFYVMALQTHPNAQILGSTTAGTDGNMSRIILPGNIITAISGIGVYYPDGKETQQVGITPDIFIEPTIKGIIDNQDELIERALAIFRNNNSLNSR